MKRNMLGQMSRLDDMGKNVNDVFSILKDELGCCETFEHRYKILELMVKFVRP